MPPDLSNELWLAIFRLCDRSAWPQLNLVSKGFHVLCLPLIYQDVDLSTHDFGIRYPLFLIATGPKPTPLDRAEAKIQKLQKAQESFLDTLLQHPEYAPFIRTLTWTLMFGPELDDQESPIDHIDHPHNQTWRVLLTLEKVQLLDLSSGHYLMRHAYVRDCPGPLFPAAKSVRLSGVMNEKLVGSIISHHPDRLEELIIDNVQHWGLHADGRPLTTDSGLNREHERMKEPGIYPPGPIRGIFDSSRRYPNLKDLFLRKVASPSVADIEWVPEADIAVYKEWASLITSVKGHLKRLTFEQAPSGTFRRANQTRRPMDQRFHDYLLPVLLEGGWNNLERLEIRGVGRWYREDPIVMNDSTKAAIADAVGPNVMLIIVEEACRLAWMWDPPGY
jgi:pimeloyl-ACP methyl ester carboxylesterase